ncbi:MAG: four helix bundle protein [Candidatus Omnitrophica bacterium]|nr:four helix bundle protein [Candidatus Omnitrophota bacterium]
MKVKSYKELEVWKKGIEIVNMVYAIANSFPDGEKYVLAAQMQRSALSIPSNIAEGFVRQYTKEYKQFLYIARGSCAELETQRIVAMRRSFAPHADLEELGSHLEHESRMLMRLIQRLNDRALITHHTALTTDA